MITALTRARRSERSSLTSAIVNYRPEFTVGDGNWRNQALSRIDLTAVFLHYDFEQTNMSNPTKSFGQKIIQGLSSLLLGAGGVVFFFGGKFLMQSRHMNFAEAEGYGIMGALLLVSLGVVVAIVGVKDPRTQNRS